MALRLVVDELPPRPSTTSTHRHRVGADALLHQTLRRRNRDQQLSATDYIRERRAKERSKEREFEHQLRDEGRALENSRIACIGEANRWAAELEDPRQFRVHRDAAGAELKVAIVEVRERACPRAIGSHSGALAAARAAGGARGSHHGAERHLDEALHA